MDRAILGNLGGLINKAKTTRERVQIVSRINTIQVAGGTFSKTMTNLNAP